MSPVPGEYQQLNTSPQFPDVFHPCGSSFSTEKYPHASRARQPQFPHVPGFAIEFTASDPTSSIDPPEITANKTVTVGGMARSPGTDLAGDLTLSQSGDDFSYLVPTASSTTTYLAPEIPKTRLFGRRRFLRQATLKTGSLRSQTEPQKSSNCRLLWFGV